MPLLEISSSTSNSASMSLPFTEITIKPHDFGGSTSISSATPRRFKGEILGQPHCFIGGSGFPNRELECTHGGSRSPPAKHPSFAAICYLLVVWSTGQQVHNFRSPPTGMWDVSFESGTISLLCCLSSHHAPYHLVLCPSPSQCPTWFSDLPQPLIVIYGHNGLSNFTIAMCPGDDIPVYGDVSTMVKIMTGSIWERCKNGKMSKGK
nr:hypothetical protein Iba_chr05cCG8800 [Ipomoea batatas]